MGRSRSDRKSGPSEYHRRYSDHEVVLVHVFLWCRRLYQLSFASHHPLWTLNNAHPHSRFIDTSPTIRDNQFAVDAVETQLSAGCRGSFLGG